MDLTLLYEYYVVLFYKYNYGSVKLLNNKQYDFNHIYETVNDFYYRNFHVSLDIEKKEDQEKLFDFLNKIFRYNLLNDILLESFDSIKKLDKDERVVDSLDRICEIVEEEHKNDELDVEEFELSKLSEEDLEKYFEEFLNIIDKDHDYLKIYNEIKRDNKIMYLDMCDENEKENIKSSLKIEDKEFNNFFFRSGKFAFIFIDRKGNIEDFIILAHEFIHYVSFLYDNNDTYYKPVTEEFPSTFYEILAGNFLVSKGYSKEEIFKLIYKRYSDTHKKAAIANNINFLLKIYLENNSITKQDIVKYIGTCSIDNNVNEDDYQIIADDLCDCVNYHLTANPASLYDHYRYVVGTHLAKEYINKFNNDKNTLDEMKNITISLFNMNSNELLNNENKSKRK